MKTNSLGFIGGGRITKIFLNAFSNSNLKFEKVVVFDTNTEILVSLTQEYSFVVPCELNEAASQPYVFIALHPPMIMETLDNISEIVSDSSLVISLAPKITIEKIASKLRTKKIARLIPNATSYINEGFNPIAFSSEMEKADKKQIKKMLNPLGKIFETEEMKLESYAIVSALLPTYFWFQFQELEKVAHQIGLTPEEATKTVKSTLKKAIKLYYNSGLTPTEVMDLIPVKPIGEHQQQISEIYQTKLIGLYEKNKP